MTTMDSDSESQDSDEGRRFRFEATRKDATSSSHSRKRRSSPAQTNSRRRSRSRDRYHNVHRDTERPRRDYNKRSQISVDVTNSSKNHATKSSKDINDSTRSSYRYRDEKDSKNSSNHKDSKDSRESSLKKPRKETKPREREKRRSHERSADRIYDEKLTNKSRDRSKRESHERSRQSSSITHTGRPRDVAIKNESSRKILRKDDNERNNEEAAKRINQSIIISKSNRNSRPNSPCSTQDCKDLNLSDFDIVSDTEENSSDNSGSRKRSTEFTRHRIENQEHNSGTKKRISKQRYERLLKRQEVKKSNPKELRQVKEKISDESIGGSNNNLRADSNFLLGDVVTTKVSANTSDESTKRQNKTSTLDTTDVESKEISFNVSGSCERESALLTKQTDSCREDVDKKYEKEGEVSSIKDKESITIASRIIGPTLPDHLRKSIGDTEVDVENTFGPALPPHLALQKDDVGKAEDKTMYPVLLDYEANKRESTESTLPESEGDDDDAVGPLPADHPDLENDVVQQQLEHRARRLKAELAACDAEDEKKREEWMIELPPAQSVTLGLGPRKFRVRPAPDMSDRSSWTDTPKDRARKQMEMLEGKPIKREKTINLEEGASQVSAEPSKSKKREKSLLEIHQKKLLKKKKKDEKAAKKTGKPIERRPFDRDVDLQANHFDEARKKRMVLKARELDDRFSRGKM